MESFNKTLFLMINSYAGKYYVLDFILSQLAQNFIWILILIEFYLFFLKNKKHIALFAFYTTMLSLTINQGVGLFFFHNRPFMDKIGFQIVSHLPENSFPSDHSAFMLSISFIFIVFNFPKKFTYSILFLSLLSAFSRVYIGIHYPLDIIGGIIIAAFATVIIYMLKEKLYKLNNLVISIIDKNIFTYKQI